MVGLRRRSTTWHQGETSCAGHPVNAAAISKIGVEKAAEAAVQLWRAERHDARLRRHPPARWCCRSSSSRTSSSSSTAGAGGGQLQRAGRARRAGAGKLGREKTRWSSWTSCWATSRTVWPKIFQQGGDSYRDTKLVLFREATRTACGYGEAASGPFYCPGDQKVYIDLAFYDELDRRFGAPGDFAQAYVLAHEIGHHVQNLLGIERQVREAPGATAAGRQPVLGGPRAAGRLLRRNLGQRHRQESDILDPGDIDEGLNAAAAVGDDKLQKQATGRVNPDSFTHGSATRKSRMVPPRLPERQHRLLRHLRRQLDRDWATERMGRAATAARPISFQAAVA